MASIGYVLKNRALLTLMLGHFTNDMFGGVLPMLFPIMKDRFGLDNAQIGLVALAYTSAASLSQPFFGYFFDRHSRRWFASATLLWGVCFVSAFGFASSYGMFLALAALAGIGSGAYHPLGASNAAAISDERHKNTALSVYTVGGTSGFALGPLVAVAVLALFGPSGTLALWVPGLAASALIFHQMRGVEMARQARRAVEGAVSGVAARPDWPALARVIGVVMLRSWVFLGVLQFVPVWYDDLGYSPRFYGALVTVVILAGTVGTISGGLLADRIGQRRIIVTSMTLAAPALLLFVGFPGPYAFLFGALFGVICDSSLSVTLVTAQRLLPGRVGMASGVILGLGFITGGIGVPITGRVADEVGFEPALMMMSVLALAGALLGLTIPSEPARVERTEAMSEAKAKSLTAGGK